MSEKIEVGVVIKGAKNAGDNLDNIGKNANNLGSAVDSLTNKLDSMTGGAVSGFKKAAQGTKAFIKGLKLTRGAIIATGVGALVVAVVGLVTAFTKTNKGAKMLKVAMAGLGAVVERVVGFLQAAGGFIVGLFTGGVTQAVDNYREGMDKLSGSIGDAVKQVMALERRTQALKTSQRDLSVQFAEGRAQIKEYNMIAEDTTRGLEERIAASEKTMAIEKELMAERQRIAQEEFDIATQRAAFGDSSEEDLDNLAQLEINLINIRTESAEMQTTLNNRLNTIRQQAKAAAKAEADAVKAAEKEKQAEIEATIQKREQLKAATNAVFLEGLDRDEREKEQLRAKFRALFKIEQDYRDQVRKDKADDFEFEVEESIRREDALNEVFIQKSDELLVMQQERREMEANIHNEYLKTEEQRELEAFQIHQDTLLAAAEAAGDDDTALRQKLGKEKQAIIDKFAQQEIQTAEATAQAVRAANMSLVRAGFEALGALAKTEEGQKKLAIAQIAVNQGIAMSNAISGAMQSASATGPAAVISAPGFVATMIGIVLSGFAQIKGVMNQAGAATENLDTSMPDMGGGGGGVGGGGDVGGGPQLALTPDLAQSFNQALGSTAVQAYVIQQDIADADALAATLQSQASLGDG